MIIVKKYDAKEIAKNAIMLLQYELSLSEKYDDSKLTDSLKTVVEYLRDCNEDYLEEIDAEYADFEKALYN